MKLSTEMKKLIGDMVKYNNKITDTINKITAMDKRLSKPIEGCGWDWYMYFRGAEKEITRKEIEAVILTALTGKKHKVENNLTYISISDIK